MLEFNITPIALDQIKTNEWLANRNPYEYQWHAYQLICEAFKSKQTLCLFLITPTGSGKTLTSYAYSIQTGLATLGIYPTNELLADQERALVTEYQQTGTNRIIRIDSTTLDHWQMELEYKRHSQTLETLLHQEPILLTNPDILFYIIFGLYPKINSLRERLWNLVASTYKLFIFDEFHLYNVKQQADTAFFVGTLNAINSKIGRVFIFASATPDLEMINLLKYKLNLDVKIVELVPSNKASAHTIAHPVSLTLMPADLDKWKGLEAFDESFEQIITFYNQYSDARFVSIFDSVASTIGIAKRFSNLFGRNSIGEIHGLSSEKMRQEALSKKVTVGTSTIEVGVDFKNQYEKDLLIFESRTSSQFLQRFGRIARHQKNFDIPNKVIAFVPSYVYNFLAENVAKGLEPTLTRDQLRNLVEDAYKQPEEFRRYLIKHASVAMAKSAEMILGSLQADDKLNITKRIDFVIKTLTGKNYEQANSKRWAYYHSSILTPLLTFRGSGLQVAIYDERAEDIGFPIKRYDLMFLLRRGIFEEISSESFIEKLDKLEKHYPNWSYEVSREKRFCELIKFSPEDLLGVYGFFRLTEIMDDKKTRLVWFEIDEDDLMGKSGKVTVLERLSIKTDSKTQLQLLNKILRRKKIVAWVLDKHPNNIKLGRALPPLFAVYELKVIRSGGGYMSQSWSMAFNQDAFFLDSLFWNLKNSTDIMVV
ncbi:MAG: type I-D CRISPR-associated helicase Cas3' [Phormidium sp.]